MDDIFFSIVIPVWNRENSVIRTINSILEQDYENFEIIVVDDFSTDNTVEKIKNINNSKIKIISHPDNRGVCAARRTGTEAAKGDWIVSLDSDWSLRKNALRTFTQMAQVANEDVGVIGGMAQLDNGTIIPENKFPEGPFGFEKYLQWVDKTQLSDYQPCRRRQVFDKIPWPSDFRLESKFHLTVAKNWKMWVRNEIIAVCHLDCENRLSSDDSNRGIQGRIKRAPYIAKDSEEIIDEFGSYLKRFAPNYYFRILFKASYFNFWSGNQWKGLKFGLQALSNNPKSLQPIGLILVGMLGVRNMIRIRGNKTFRKLSQEAHKRSQ